MSKKIFIETINPNRKYETETLRFLEQFIIIEPFNDKKKVFIPACRVVEIIVPESREPIIKKPLMP